MKLLYRMKAWVYALSILVCSFATGTNGQAAPKAIVLAWDGAVPAFVHEMLRDGKLPNLAELIEGGAFADDVMPGFLSLTAPGFASLWTGAPPRVTGISGNRVPRLPSNEFTILDSRIGFNPALLRAEPFWAAAERTGRKIVTIYAPLAGDKSESAVHLQSYSGIAGRDGVVSARVSRPRLAPAWKNIPKTAAPPREISFSIGASTFFGLFIDDPEDSQQGYDTMLLSDDPNGRKIQGKLKAAAPGPGGELFWSGPIDIQTKAGQPAVVYLRLFDLKPDGSDYFLYFTRPARPTATGQPELPHEASPSTKAFVGNGAHLLYVNGMLGPTVFNGGDGIAETRYLESVVFVQHQLMETVRWVFRHLPWDLIIAYSPYPDEAEHLWRGYLDPKLPGYRPEIAARVRPFLERVYGTADELLGLLMKLRPKNTVLALASDHGMDAANKLLCVNAALQRSHLLTLDAQSRVDLSKTKILYPSINNGYLLINTTARKNGIVSPNERDEIVRRARESLLNIRDGERRVVTAVYDPETEGATLGIGGEGGGDLYFDLLPGYEPNAKLKSRNVINARAPHGTHGFNPARPSMHTLMVLNGPWIKSGIVLQDVRIIDFAPTLSRALELPAPKNSWGRIIKEAFTESH